MVRFTAPERDIEQMLRFLARRMPGGTRLVPLQAAHRDELRWRRTIRPLLSSLRDSDGPISWGIREATPANAPQTPRLVVSRDTETGILSVDPDASELITFALGPADGPERRREALLLVRDWDLEAGNEPDPALTERADQARSIVERTARHLRRNSRRENNRWIVSPESQD